MSCLLVQYLVSHLYAFWSLLVSTSLLSYLFSTLTGSDVAWLLGQRQAPPTTCLDNVHSCSSKVSFWYSTSLLLICNIVVVACSRLSTCRK